MIGAAAAGILRGPACRQMSGCQLEHRSCPPAFPKATRQCLFCPPAGDQNPSCPTFDTAVSRGWQVVSTGGKKKGVLGAQGEDRLQHPQPLHLLPRAVHAALQPKQSPTCLRTSRRGHENGLCCQSGSSVTASPVDVRELSWLPCRVSWWSSR